MTDHLSHRLDNRLRHLRWADYSLNNSNRTAEDHTVGVSRVVDGHGQVAHRARWKLQDTEHSRFFYVNTCGSEATALEAAHQYRTKIFESKPDAFEPLDDNTPSTNSDLDLIAISANRVRAILDRWRSEQIMDVSVYLLETTVPNKDEMFEFYSRVQLQHYSILESKLEQLETDQRLVVAKLERLVEA